MSSKTKEKSFEPFRTIIIAGALALMFRSLLFEPFNIPSGSMIPTLKVGDYLFVSKFSYGYSRYSFPFGIIPFDGRVMAGEPERGDVVVFRQPGNEDVAFIKRIVGLPGDDIQVKRGALHINGTPVKREHEDVGTATDGFSVMKYNDYVETLPEGTSHSIREISDAGSLDNTRVYSVPEGHYFVMGDNRDNSNDSRGWGFVPDENLVGKAFMIWMVTPRMAASMRATSPMRALRRATASITTVMASPTRPSIWAPTSPTAVRATKCVTRPTGRQSVLTASARLASARPTSPTAI